MTTERDNSMSDEHEADNADVVELLEARRDGRRAVRLAEPSWFGFADSMAGDGITRGVSLFIEWDEQRVGFHLSPDDAEWLAEGLMEQARKARERMGDG